MMAAQRQDMDNSSGFRMQLSAAARCCDTVHRGADVMLHGVSTDTRRLRTGELYIALRGEHFDGHDFLAQAAERGAAAVMIDQNCDTSLPALPVNNTRTAMGRLAACWRERFEVPVVAVTGSNGKTTVKEMLAAILACRGRVLATAGNLNNDIGVPLTLFRLDDSHDSAVIELGANHPGEIDYLAGLVSPDVGIVTNAGPAHLEGFGSLEGVARAKGELFARLAADATAVLNADDPFYTQWCETAAHCRQVSFGIDHPADVRAVNVRLGEDSEFDIEGPWGSATVCLSLPGRHNVMNALAAAAAALAVGATILEVITGLSSLQAVQGRLQIRRGLNGSRVIDDTYNANPESLQAAIRVLAGYEGRRVLVLGDMAELGDKAAQLHWQAGRTAHEQGIDALYTLGELSHQAASAFGKQAHSFNDRDSLIRAVTQQLSDTTTVLVKGSRAMHMEQVVSALTGDNEA